MSTDPTVETVLPRPLADIRDEEWMRLAIDVANRTPAGDVPVGAIVVGPDGEIIAEATNRREADADPMAHAEVLALQRAAKALGDGWRLEDCTLVVTLEPCVMCAGAAVMSRVGRVVFGAWSAKTGACGSLVDVIREPAHVFAPQVRGGVLADECAGLLPAFFQGKR
ncbi:tRNA adenosine(34) deaminase TadA [Corynebacterium sp. H78]|uniref:tRNA adenosine(34) deaminase TadA n=1 Tax=Corynebacterium sp. H78 TaxID=3133417 RepID=UPI003098C2DC